MPDLGGPDGRNTDERQPEFVCLTCAEKYGGPMKSQPMWNMGTCDVCDLKRPVVSPRVFGDLDTGWEQAVDRYR